MAKDQNGNVGAASNGAEKQPVGKGHPPADSKWKTGQSGNPKGRPKGARNVSTVIIQMAKRPVTISVNGQSKSMSALEAQLQTMMARGLQGKPHAEGRMLELYEKYLPPDDEAGTPKLSEAELGVLRNHIKLQKLLDEAEPDNEQPPSEPKSNTAQAPGASSSAKPDKKNDGK